MVKKQGIILLFLVIFQTNLSAQEIPVLSDEAKELISNVKNLRNTIDKIIQSYHETQQAVIEGISVQIAIINEILAAMFHDKPLLKESDEIS